MHKKYKDNVKKGAVALLAAVTVGSTFLPATGFAQEVKHSQPSMASEKQILDEGKAKAAQIQLTEGQKREAQANARILHSTADTSITTLMLQRRNTSYNEKTEFAYTPSVNQTSPYEAGTLTAYGRVPLQGNVLNRSILPTNGAEHIKNFREGNYGARVNLVFPKGVDARAMIDTIDWPASQASTKDDFYIKAIGIPTPIHLNWGLTWDRSSIQLNPNAPNEFSILLRGIKRSEVTNAEWNKYNPLVTEGALALVGAIPGGGILGNMDGWAEGKLKFDMAKYSGNTDDITKNKELTAKRLFPDKSRHAKFTINLLDQNSLMAGVGGTGDIRHAVVKQGHEHDNPQTSNGISTWDSYLSIWDNEGTYNTNMSEEDLVPGQRNALPGDSIFNRQLTVKKGENFNDFAPKRFDRVINYFTKQDITEGHIGEVNDVRVSHTPSRVPDGKTNVTYSGEVSYLNGEKRALIPNRLSVTNNSNSSSSKGNIFPNAYKIGEANMTGAYTGDVSWVRLYINGTSIRSGGAFNNGQFTFYAGGLNIHPSDRVTFNAYDKDNNLLQENVPVQITQESTRGTINPVVYTPGEATLTGYYTGDVSLAKLYVNGSNVSVGGTFNSNGSFSYYVGNKIKAGDSVYIIALDKNGKELDRKNVQVAAASTSGTIYPGTYTVGTSMISGSYTGDISSARLFVNGRSISWGGNFANGQFSYYVKSDQIKPGDIVTLEAYDKNGKKLDSKLVPVHSNLTGAFTLATYKLGDTTIKGTFSGGISIAKVYVNGQPQAWGGTFGGGSFSYYIGRDKIRAYDNVTIEGYDKNNQLLTTKNVTILP